MDYWLIFEIVYIVVVALVCLRIIYDTRSTSKTLAYLLFAVFIPVAGILFYFIFGINYRKRTIYSRKLAEDAIRLKALNEHILPQYARHLRRQAHEVGEGESLVSLIMNDSLSPLTTGNAVRLLINGEEKFPEVIGAMQQARHHIHLEYYIFEDDHIGNRIKEVLMAKAREGVAVRMIYDGFGSAGLRHELLDELHKAGVEAYPFNRVRLPWLANRINYRNHRKIIIIDGQCGFLGGINISDEYINGHPHSRHPYWRDTHLRIDGPGILFLQHLFLCDWNFCADQNFGATPEYFNTAARHPENISVQIAASGPDSPASTIMLSFLKAINLAKSEILLSTPYFIPGSSILDALKVSALGGVKVKLLVPGISDSLLVNAAAWSNYGELLRAGVEICLYQKGFMHAKTLVVDRFLSVVGTANMDLRSFDLNFEVNAIVYSEEFADRLRRSFLADLSVSEPIQFEVWRSRPYYKHLPERLARLLSPLL